MSSADAGWLLLRFVDVAAAVAVACLGNHGLSLIAGSSCACIRCCFLFLVLLLLLVVVASVAAVTAVVGCGCCLKGNQH